MVRWVGLLIPAAVSLATTVAVGTTAPGAPAAAPVTTVPTVARAAAAVATDATQDVGVAGLGPGTGEPVEVPGAPQPVPDDGAGPLASQAHRAGRAAIQTVTITVTGDILLHLPVIRAAETPGRRDFTPMLAPVAPVIGAADLALCHLEIPISADGSGLSGYPVFNAPPEIAAAIAAAGYDGCSTASNHSMDQGARGVSQTLDALDAAGLGHAGTARSAAEDAAPRLYRVGALTIGHVAAAYGLNGFSVPADQPWLVDLIDPVDGVLAEAAAARAAGADIVVVSTHMGEEYQTAPTAYQRSVAERLLASPDVDLVVGHHAHVVQPIERVGDKAVVFGLGNLLSGQDGAHTAGTQDGVAVTVTMVRAAGGAVRVADIAYTPTWVEPGSYRVIPIEAALADPAIAPDRRHALEASLARTTAAIGPQAHLSHP